MKHNREDVGEIPLRTGLKFEFPDNDAFVVAKLMETSAWQLSPDLSASCTANPPHRGGRRYTFSFADELNTVRCF